MKTARLLVSLICMLAFCIGANAETKQCRIKNSDSTIVVQSCYIDTNARAVKGQLLNDDNDASANVEITVTVKYSDTTNGRKYSTVVLAKALSSTSFEIPIDINKAVSVEVTGLSGTRCL